MGGLGNDHYAALNVPAKNDLRHSLAIFFAYFCKDGVGEKSPSTLAEGRPRLVRNAVLCHPFVSNLLLIVRVRFNLINHGFYARERADVHKPVGIEI